MNILFHDVDGCLNVDAATPVPMHTDPIPALQKDKLLELGRKVDSSSIDHFVINTGRSLEETLPVAQQMNCEKLRFVVCEHGAVYHDIKLDEPVLVPVPIIEKQQLIQEFIAWYRQTGALILNRATGTEIPVLNKVSNLTLDARNQPGTRLIHDELQALVLRKSPFNVNELVFHHNEVDGFVDVMGSLDKGDGVEVITSLCSTVQSPVSSINTFAIGNGLNDMPMLEAAKTPVCPKNAEPEVKKYCRCFSGTVSEYEFIQATLHWLEVQMH